MKTLLLLAAMLPFAASAQTKKPTTAKSHATIAKHASPQRQSPGLDGIGIFKIGVTNIDDLQDFAKSKATHVDMVADEASIYTPSDSIRIALIIPNVEYDYTIHTASCPEAQVYYLSSYEVAGIRLSEVFLTFYNKKLIDFKCEYSSELTEALTLKYGKPRTEATEKLRNCVFIHTGNKITYKDITTKESWENGSIHATATMMRWYDSSCKEHFASYFSIGNPHQLLALYSCNDLHDKIKAQAEQKEKKKKLSDL